MPITYHASFATVTDTPSNSNCNFFRLSGNSSWIFFFTESWSLHFFHSSEEERVCAMVSISLFRLSHFGDTSFFMVYNLSIVLLSVFASLLRLIKSSDILYLHLINPYMMD